MKMNAWQKTLGAGLTLAMALTATRVPADETTGIDFYRGKKIQIIVGFDVGGGYDAYSRLLGRHMGRHLPGDPPFIVQNMPGAGSRVAANHLYNLAPKDGTVLGSVVQSTPVDQILGEPGIRYDATKFAWIGNPIIDNLVTVVATGAGLSTLADVGAKGGLICGSSGAGPTLAYPRIMAKLLPADIRVVPGYPGVTAINVAIERNEVNCIGGTGWSSMKATMSQMMREGKLKVLLQWGAGRDPEIDAFAGTEVPMMDVLAKTPADRDAVLIVSATTALSRPLLGPPGLPAERIELLRRAFDATMRDAQFLEDAKRLKMDINPISGAVIQDIVARVVGSSPEGIARAKELTN
jgi:tripartite-type tricarboxylate transporter receptor subunit TctC